MFGGQSLGYEGHLFDDISLLLLSVPFRYELQKAPHLIK